MVLIFRRPSSDSKKAPRRNPRGFLLFVRCEGLELHTFTWPHMDSIDLDPQPILGIGSDIY